MPAYARREIVSHDEIGVYHCIARCVRRAFLCGVDPLTGKNHEHRRHWIRNRLEQLASFFAIEVCGYAVMSNHLHASIELEKYLSLLDWTGRQLRADGSGTIPGHFAPILERLGVNFEGWIQTVQQFGRWFKRAAGRRDSLAALAHRSGRRWFQGQRAATIAFR
jgi:REP element-mobilizing transposase RayT